MPRLSIIGGLALAILSVPVFPAAIVVSSTGTSVASITPARDLFRLDIGGGTVAGANGSFGGVRREINWDGVPDMFSAPNFLPADFFNVNSPRGVIYSTPGTGFEVSANAGVAPINFGNIDPSYTGNFAPFSPQRLFTQIGSNVEDVNFFLAGTNTPATVNAFGVVFSDVDLANTTSLQFFDSNNSSLGTFFAPNTVGSQTFSFLGVEFNAGERVARVHITTGNAALAPGVIDQHGNPIDLVVMDDFLYSEPAVVPEPSAFGLCGAGLAAAGIYKALRGKVVLRPKGSTC
jgi:hypothetical protein